MMDWLFGRRKTPQELLRQNQRALNKAMRELDRERQHLEQQEIKTKNDIRKMAKMGQMDAVKVMAKDIVRTRRYIKKFIMMKANIQGVSLKVQTLKSTDAMAQAMKGVTKALHQMNRQLNLPQIQKIMTEFERESEIMDMKEEMMTDAIDDAIGEEGDEEETDEIVKQVLDEMGLQITDDLAKIPGTGKAVPAQAQSSGPGRVAAAAAAGGGGGAASGGAPSGGATGGAASGGGATSSDADDDLLKRLENLRKPT